MKELKDVLGIMATGLKSFSDGISVIATKVDELASALQDQMDKPESADTQSEPEDSKAEPEDAEAAASKPATRPEGKTKKKPTGETTQKQVKKSAEKAARRPAGKAARKPAGSEKAKTATDTVLDLVLNTKDGISTAAIAEATGFERKKISNILQRVKKQGKVKTLKRGVYTKA